MSASKPTRWFVPGNEDRAVQKGRQRLHAGDGVSPGRAGAFQGLKKLRMRRSHFAPPFGSGYGTRAMALMW